MTIKAVLFSSSICLIFYVVSFENQGKTSTIETRTTSSTLHNINASTNLLSFKVRSKRCAAHASSTTIATNTSTINLKNLTAFALSTIPTKQNNTNVSKAFVLSINEKVNNRHKRLVLNKRFKKLKLDTNNLQIDPLFEFNTIKIIQNIKTKRSLEKSIEEFNSEHKQLIITIENFFEQLTLEQKNELNKIKLNKMLTREQIEEQIDQWAENESDNVKVKIEYIRKNLLNI